MSTENDFSTLTNRYAVVSKKEPNGSLTVLEVIRFPSATSEEMVKKEKEFNFPKISQKNVEWFSLERLSEEDPFPEQLFVVHGQWNSVTYQKDCQNDFSYESKVFAITNSKEESMDIHDWLHEQEGRHIDKILETTCGNLVLPESLSASDKRTLHVTTKSFPVRAWEDPAPFVGTAESAEESEKEYSTQKM